VHSKEELVSDAVEKNSSISIDFFFIIIPLARNHG
jgi:hypothetical protein